MDSLTQITLGAAVGEATLGNKLGNKAPIWGAVLGFLPDVDVFFQNLFDTVDSLFIHRGLTHSLFFAVAFGVLGAWGLSKTKFSQEKNISFWLWFGFLSLCIFTHAVLDLFTTYGTAILYPFDTTRFGWDGVFIIDPLYTLPLLIMLIIAIRRPTGSWKRKKLVLWSLAITTCYLFLGVFFRWEIQAKVNNQFQHVEIENAFLSPTPFNIFLWTAVVNTEEGFYLENHHIFKEEATWKHFLPKEKIPEKITDNIIVKRVKKFTREQAFFWEKDGKIFLTDLRFFNSFLWNGKRETLGWTFLIAEKIGNEWELTVKLLQPESFGQLSSGFKKLGAELF